MKSTERKTCILVLGMHRSGTSALTRTLGLLGARMPRNPLPPTRNNERGYWEPADLMRLNDQLLDKLKSSWHDWRSIDSYNLSQVSGEFHQKFFDILNEEFEEADLFVVKDPRICRFAPLLLDSLDSQGTQSKVVICIRNPLEVAASLERRNGFPREKSLLLWLRHVLDAESCTRHRPRAFVCYEQLLRDWRAVAESMGELLNLQWPRSLDEAAAEIEEFLSSDLRHYVHDAASLSEYANLQWMLDAYQACIALEQSPYDPEALEKMDRIRTEFEGTAALFLPELNALEETLGETRKSLEERSAQAAAVQEEVGELRQALQAEQDRWRETCAELRAKTAASEQRADHLERIGERQKSRIGTLETGIAHAKKRARQADRLASEQRARAEALERDLSSQRAQVQSLEKTAAEQRERISNLEQRVASSDAKAKEMERVAAERNDALARQRQATQQAQQELSTEQAKRIDLQRKANSSRWLLRQLATKLTHAPLNVPRRASQKRKEKRRYKRNYRLIAESGLFDREWYLKNNPDVAEAGIDPVRHYLLYGGIEGRAPGPKFDSEWYLAQNPDVAEAVENPLLHFIEHGRREGRKSNASFEPSSHAERGGTANGSAYEAPPLERNVRRSTIPIAIAPASEQFQALFSDGFPDVLASPCVSIIIAAYNELDFTLRCVESVRRCTAGDYEVIVVDDCSTDTTPETLKRIPNLVYIRNAENLGFLKTSNLGAKKARADILVFLNNDTEVTAGWLPPLLELLNTKGVGAVGPKLVYPNGSIQEAGAIYWQDARGTNYGRGHPDPDAPQFNYIKEVDKCSGTCLMTRRALFFANGEGFDSQFAPAYKEDADFCFRVRQSGLRVMYQPASVVFHHEGVSCGTDVTTGVKRYQELNRPTFIAKWKHVLERDHLPNKPANILIARERPYNSKIALVIDDKVPEYDKHAGGMGMFHYVKLLGELGYKVIFVPDNKRRIEPYTTELQQMGVEVFYGAFKFEDILNDHGKNIDIAWLSRPVEAAKYIDAIRNNTNAKIFYCGRDLHFLRTQRRGEVQRNEYMLQEAERLRQLEHQLFVKADVVLTFSEYEYALISELAPLARVKVIAPYVMHQLDTVSASVNARNDLIFVGGFKHSPNLDAAMWFIDECWPLVKEAVRDARFFVIGSDPPETLLDRASPDIILCRHVKNIGPYFEGALASVAPLRFGAGVKGKIITSMKHGCPVVTTTIGAEGMGLVDGVHALIADTPQGFADALQSLSTDKTAREKIVTTGREYVSQRFSSDAVRRNFEMILREAGAVIPSPAFYRVEDHYAD